MSYEIVKSINIKNRTITSACNNVRPLIYTTGGFTNDNGSEESFIKHCLVAFAEGSFHSSSESVWKFNYALIKARENRKEEYEKAMNGKWNANGKEEWQKYDKQLEDLLYSEYININEKKEKYVLMYGTSFIHKIKKRGFSYTGAVNLARVYDNYAKAKIASKKLELLNNIKIVKLSEVK